MCTSACVSSSYLSLNVLGAANILFGFPKDAKEVQETILHFDWAPATMTSGRFFPKAVFFMRSIVIEYIDLRRK